MLHYSEEMKSEESDDMNSSSGQPKSHMERESRKSRREIANNNERKRMLSINAGFEQLRAQLPISGDDRLSKSAVLQQAVSHIQKLELDRNHLKQNNTRLIERCMELTKSHCSSSCACKGKCCPKDLLSTQSVRERLIDSQPLQPLQDDPSPGMVHDLTKHLTEVQAQLETERKKSSVMEKLITQILRNPSGAVATCGSNDNKSRVRAHNAASKRKLPLVEQDTSTICSQSSQQILSASSQTSVPFLASRRSNLDTIVEAIRHLEEESSSSLVKRLRLANTSASIEGSVNKILCSSDIVGSSGVGMNTGVACDVMYSVDDHLMLRQDDTPTVAAFEFVSGEPYVAYVQCDTGIEQMLSDQAQYKPSLLTLQSEANISVSV